ncbi:MAG TPA: hypothetical protein VGV35_12090, partial [Bryobacteraceae bacterium]|nr:hypothetical protein [Bryobacteraceae bacterium]
GAESMNLAAVSRVESKLLLTTSQRNTNGHVARTFLSAPAGSAGASNTRTTVSAPHNDSEPRRREAYAHA